MPSGTKKVTVTGNHTLRFEWEETETNVSGNYSTIHWELYVDTDAYGKISLGGSQAWSVTIDGVESNGTDSGGFSANQNKLLGSGNTTVYHSDDGTKTFNFSFEKYFGFTWGNVFRGTYSGSGSDTLSTIPRASDLNVSNGTLGTSQVITANRKASNFTHTLRWFSASQGGTIATNSSETSWNFTPPLEVAADSLTSKSVQIDFELETFNGGTLVGKKSASVIMSIPASTAPNVEVFISDTTTCFDELGKYLQGQSRLKVRVDALAKFGASITSYKITADGKTYTSSEFTTPTLQSEGTQKVIVVVTDSRNYSTTIEAEIEIQSYNVPRITLLTVVRCNADGVYNMSGVYARVTYSFTVASASAGQPVLKYKRPIDVTPHEIRLPGGQSADNATIVFPADDGYPYEIELVITDAFGSASRKTSLSTGYTLIHYPASGRGITFGGVATGDGFNVMMEAHFSQGITQDVRDLPSGNCNELTVSGVYFIGIYGKNRPASNLAGWLTVTASPDGVYCFQQYVTYNGQIWIRFLEDGSWKNWCNTMTWFA